MNTTTNLETLLNLQSNALENDSENGGLVIPDFDIGVPRITAEIVRRILVANTEV